MQKSILFLAMISGYTASAQSWNVTGNTGINPSINFVGTLKKEPLVFRVNNLEQMRINPVGRITFQGENGAGAVWNKNLFLGGGIDNPTGAGNTVFGLGSLTGNAIADGNTAMGNNVLSALSWGSYNTGVGNNTFEHANSGSYNTGIGAAALQGAGIMDGNTAVGQGAMARYTATATDNISFNTATGMGALFFLSNGDFNCAYGKDALWSLKGGRNNIGIGENAGLNLEDGENNIFIGAQTPAFTNSTKNELNIGNWIFGVNGTIGIGKFSNPLPYDGVAPDGETYKLFVKDGIRTEKIKVDIAADNGWADYVFHKDYSLLPLKDLDVFIQQNGHLPEVPSTEEAIKNGVELKAMNILLLKKIEELTLYSIEQQKRSTEQQQRIEALEQQMQSKH